MKLCTIFFHSKQLFQLSGRVVKGSGLALLLLTCVCHTLKAQQVNGVFTDFAKNPLWANIGMNGVKIETNGDIILSGYYELFFKAGLNGAPDTLPNKFPLLVRLNSSGVPKTDWGSLNRGYANTFNFITSNNGSAVIDRSHLLSDGGFLIAGHYENGQGYLTKAFVTGSRPTAFNGGNVLTYQVPQFTSKTYIEDWVVTSATTYTVRMEGVLANAQNIVVTAFNNTTGVPLPGFGTNGETEIRLPDYFELRHKHPVKIARNPADGKIYVAYTQKETPVADNIILFRLNSNGIIDSAFGNNGGIGYANFPVPSPYAITSLLLNGDGTITMGGYDDNGPASNVSFRTYHPSTQVISSTSFGAPANQIGVGAGCTTVGAVADANGGNERTVFAVAFPFEANRFRIFIQTYQSGNINATLNLTPWQYPGALSAEPTVIVRLSNGSFIVVGNMLRQNGTKAGLVIKFNADGTIDNSFGEQGSYIVNGSANISGMPWTDVAHLPNNKYVTAGGTSFIPEAPGEKGILINQFNADGSIDTSFGTYGALFAYQNAKYGRSVLKMEALPDGKFLMGGTYTNAPGEPGTGTSVSRSNVTIYKMLPDGSPDNDFGVFNNGRCHFSGWIGLGLTDLKVQQDTIYIGANTGQSHTGRYDAIVFKVNPNGVINSQYLAHVEFLHTFIISDVTGIAYVGGGINGSPKAICKVKPGLLGFSGRPDSSFGVNGRAVLPIVPEGEAEITTIKHIKLRPGYILVVSEWQFSNTNLKKGIFFTLISQQGIVEPGFGNGGNKFLQLPGASSIEGELFKSVDNDSHLLIFGQAIVGGQTKGFICKVDLDGNLVADFGTGGVIWTTATYTDPIIFDNNEDMVAIRRYGLIGGAALAKLQIPDDVYNRIKQGSWTGAISNDWFNTGNWAEGTVPDAFTEVVIASGAVIIPANTHATAYKVTVMPGATLSLGANSTLTITKNSP